MAETWTNAAPLSRRAARCRTSLILFLTLLLLLASGTISGANSPADDAAHPPVVIRGTLAGAVETVSRAFHVQVDVDWKDLEEAGLSRTQTVQPVSCGSLHDALNGLVQGTKGQLCYIAGGQSVRLTVRGTARVAANEFRSRQAPSLPRPPAPAVQVQVKVQPQSFDGVDALNRRVAHLDLTGVPFNEAIQRLADATQANIVIRQAALKEAAVDPLQPVDVHLWDVSVRTALTTLLSGIDGEKMRRVGFEQYDEAIVITTQEELQADTITVGYDIHDIVATALKTDLAVMDGRTELPTSGDISDDLMKLLTETVAPESWRDAGGSTGAIRQLMGVFFITQTRENHRKVVDLLREVRSVGRVRPLRDPRAEGRSEK